jgi:paired amphipathic helix protein Sin3a
MFVSIVLQNGDPGPLAWTPEAAAIHAQFLDMAHSLLRGNVDPSVYEDDCRALLGTNSYELFTLDKLLLKLVKQVQTVLAEEGFVRLLDLWRYENARTVPVMDAVYHSNAHIVMGDEQAFRFEHTLDRQVTVQVMEPDKADAVPAILEPAFRDYVEAFMDNEDAPPAAASAAEGTRVCLVRNLPAVTDAAAAAATLQGVAVVNGLECKLGSTAAQKIKKIAYVLGTEDYFHRPGRSNVAHAAKAGDRAAKFRSWVDGQATAVEPMVLGVRQ